jgi:hypothetical protein
MRKITHIQALTSFADDLFTTTPNNQKGSKPVLVLSNYLGLPSGSSKFSRILTWIISFYQEGVSTIGSSTLSEKNKVTASQNVYKLFVPFMPPFEGANLDAWFKQAMSDTNQSYFDLLSDAILDTHPIFVPDAEDIHRFKSDLTALLSDMEGIGLPKWINDDFAESIGLTILALDKLPFLAHKIIQDSHNTILARLFSVTTPEHKKFMVKVATTMNVVFAAFIMPFEAQQATSAYYNWMLESPIDTKQIDACSAPLALPAPHIAGL